MIVQLVQYGSSLWVNVIVESWNNSQEQKWLHVELHWNKAIYWSGKGHITVPVWIFFGKFNINFIDWKFLLAMFEWSDTHDYMLFSLPTPSIFHCIACSSQVLQKSSWSKANLPSIFCCKEQLESLFINIISILWRRLCNLH